jgi:hypothetical protein
MMECRYDTPNPLGTAEQAKGCEQRDLAALSDFALWREQKHVEWALTWNDTWLVQRGKPIRAESERRNG